MTPKGLTRQCWVCQGGTGNDSCTLGGRSITPQILGLLLHRAAGWTAQLQEGAGTGRWWDGMPDAGSRSVDGSTGSYRRRRRLRQPGAPGGRWLRKENGVGQAACE